MGGPLEKDCPVCGARVRSRFWHLFRKHPKEDVIKALLRALDLPVDVKD